MTEKIKNTRTRVPLHENCSVTDIRNIMAGLSASGLKTNKYYTETDSNVLTDAVLENIILNAQYRIFRDVPIDADKKQQLGNFVAGQETINAPAKTLFMKRCTSL